MQKPQPPPRNTSKARTQCHLWSQAAKRTQEAKTRQQWGQRWGQTPRHGPEDKERRERGNHWHPKLALQPSATHSLSCSVFLMPKMQRLKGKWLPHSFLFPNLCIEGEKKKRPNETRSWETRKHWVISTLSNTRSKERPQTYWREEKIKVPTRKVQKQSRKITVALWKTNQLLK